MGRDRLTDAECRKRAHVDDEGAARVAPYKVSDGQGLYLLVQERGARLWRMKYRHDGSERVYSIGAYPEVSLAAARAERDRAREWLRAGKDPTIERRTAKALGSSTQASTFGAMAEEWLAKMGPRWSTAYRSAQRSRLDNELLPHLGGVPLVEVKPAAILETLRRIEARGAHEVASKSRVMVSQIFRYAVQTSRAESDPAALLSGALVRPPAQHRATIPLADMPRLFEAVAIVPAETVTKLALYWLILTAARTAEMRFAPWSEIEGDKLWRIPAARMKMAKEHLVPLSRQAREIVQAAKALRTSKAADALVFPGFTRHGALSENALLALLARAGYFGRQTSHGFRASFSTWAHEVAEADPDVIEACLAHSRGDVRAIYNRSSYLSKRSDLLQRWADQCSAWGMKT
ncbi:MAG: integrase arm-type DNA-binding domain-containing protein [Alphaproteobacteria bacterium]|nr:integrase arm-type DNA-binding domain-containing protein [Alphaproteobacteria bacterium]